MYAYKDVLELAGLTTRLYTLLSTLHNLPALPSSATDSTDNIELSNVDVVIPLTGTIIEDDEDTHITELVESTIMTPLVKDLSLVLRKGEHLMITGSNGVGKTSIARVLAGLWAPSGPDAEIKRPSDKPGQPSLFVVPQRAYMVTGSLLEQMIYPHSYAEFKESGKTIEDMIKILEMVHLSYLPEREGGWTTRKEWRDVLSGGEKQRVRILPSYRSLLISFRWEWRGFSITSLHLQSWTVCFGMYDLFETEVNIECTSAMSSDVEGLMYEHAKLLGITLITISLRSVHEFHTPHVV